MKGWATARRRAFRHMHAWVLHGSARRVPALRQKTRSKHGRAAAGPHGPQHGWADRIGSNGCELEAARLGQGQAGSLVSVRRLVVQVKQPDGSLEPAPASSEGAAARRAISHPRPAQPVLAAQTAHARPRAGADLALRGMGGWAGMRVQLSRAAVEAVGAALACNERRRRPLRPALLLAR